MQKNMTQAKFQILLAMLYITTLLAANVLIYKITVIHSYEISVGSFIIPFLYVQADVMAEVYGYYFAKRIIWMSILCEFIFSLVCKAMVMTPDPSNWHFAVAYDHVLGSQMRIFTGNLLGTVIGSIANVYLISRWKILTRGKYFIVRSIGSSMFGQLIFTVITLTFDMLGVFNLHDILSFITISYIIKIIFTPIASTIAGIASNYLKQLKMGESFDVREFTFNPFKKAN